MLVSVVAVLALGGCGNGTPATVATTPTSSPKAKSASADPTRGTPDPCALISAEEVAAAFKVSIEPPGPPRTVGPYAQKVCLFEGSGGGSGIIVTIFTMSESDWARAKGLYASETTAIDGIGDEAFIRRGQVWTRRGMWMVSIDVVGFDQLTDRARDDGAIAVARILTAKL